MRCLGLVAFSDFIAHTPREPSEWLFTVSDSLVLIWRTPRKAKPDRSQRRSTGSLDEPKYWARTIITTLADLERR